MPSPRLLVIEGNSPQTLADHIAVGGTAAHQGYSNLLRELLPGAIVDTCHTVSDISHIRRLGWEPTVPVEENVRQYIEWLETQSVSQEYLLEAERVMQESGVIQLATAS